MISVYRFSNFNSEVRGGLSFHMNDQSVQLFDINSFSVSSSVGYYYYNVHIGFGLRLSLSDLLPNIHVENLAKNSDKVVVYDCAYEVVRINRVANDIKFLVDRGVRSNQVYVLVVDQLSGQVLGQKLADLGILGVNIDSHNGLVKRSFYEYLQYISSSRYRVNRVSRRRFSCFSRRYSSDRVLLYFHLLSRNLLDQFHYTFTHYNPYQKGSVVDRDQILDLVRFDDQFISVKSRIESWVDGLPYLAEGLENFNVGDQSAVFNYLLFSDFHLVVETFFSEVFAINFITEKTYKAILVGRPFIVYGQPHSLVWLRSMGFSTFESHIDQSYDLELDPIKRRDLVVQQVQWLSQLSTSDFQQLLVDLQPQVNHNKLLLYQLNRQGWVTDLGRTGMLSYIKCQV